MHSSLLWHIKSSPLHKTCFTQLFSSSPPGQSFSPSHTLSCGTHVPPEQRNSLLKHWTPEKNHLIILKLNYDFNLQCGKRSSELSPQSFFPLHTWAVSIQCPLSQLNSFFVHSFTWNTVNGKEFN